MFRRSWQSAMIALARSPGVTRFMHRSRGATRLARKFVAGPDATEAVERAAHLHATHAIRSSVFHLGEYVDRPDLVELNVRHKLNVIETLAHAALDLHVSADPTQIGQSIDFDLARRNAVRMAEVIDRLGWNKPGVHCLMFDMEDASLVDATIGLHDEIRQRGLPVALTLQSHLRRTRDDLRRQIAAGGRVRLVKGAFVAGGDIAYTRQRDIKANYRRLMEQMLSARALRRGFYPIIATHDDRMHEAAIATARRNGWKPGQYEFEMLLGVRPDVAGSLARRGERVRLYLPFGREWWPYAVRRVGENPRNAMLLARSLFR